MNAAADEDKHDAPVIHDDPSASAEADTKNAPRIHELFAADMIAQAAQAIAASAPSYNIANYGSLTDPDAGCAAASATGNATVIATVENHASSEESMASAMTEALPSPASRHPSAFVPNIPNLPNFPTETMTMDELLEEQKKAQLEIHHAEEEVQRAKDILDKATQHKLDIDARVKALTESSVDALLHENNRWNGMYKQLVEYKQENGHCHLVRSPKKKNSSEKCKLQALGIWASQARLDARRPVGHPDRLPPYKIHALDRLGFDWEPRENYWMDMYQQLKAYLAKSRGKMPPRFINNQKFALGQWCDTQLDNYRKLHSGKKGAYITPRKIEMLEQIGFVWDKRGQVWRDNYERLKEFKAKYGHCNATASKNGGDKAFGMWVTKQKGKYLNWLDGKTNSKDFSLTDEQAALMDDIGFSECVELDKRRTSGRPRKVTCDPEDKNVDEQVNISDEDIESS